MTFNVTRAPATSQGTGTELISVFIGDQCVTQQYVKKGAEWQHDLSSAYPGYGIVTVNSTGSWHVGKPPVSDKQTLTNPYERGMAAATIISKPLEPPLSIYTRLTNAQQTIIDQRAEINALTDHNDELQDELSYWTEDDPTR